MPPRKSFPLRLSPELYEELRRWADQEFRSVNAQIEFLLREAVRRVGECRVDVYAVATVQEEVGLRGARTDGSDFPDGVELLRSRAYPVLMAPAGARLAVAVRTFGDASADLGESVTATLAGSLAEAGADG